LDIVLYNPYFSGITVAFRLNIILPVICIIILNLIFLPLASTLKAADPIATNIRVGTHLKKTRVVIDVSNKIDFRIFALSDPNRIVIDLPEMTWQLPDDVIPKNLMGKRHLIKNFRYGYFRPGLSRIVLDIKNPVRVKAAFIITPSNGKNYRLVIDLVQTTRKKFLNLIRKSKLKKSSEKKDERKLGPKKNLENHLHGLVPTKKKARNKKGPENQLPQIKAKPVIVIDPGHGGIDPGATSGRVFEKHITLVTAKVIESHLKGLGRYRVFLTRKTDKFVRLRKRIAIAKALGANLFISLHADSIKNRRVRGLSVYTLSERASDKEAADLARKENKSDVIAGVDLSTESPVVSDILIDLRQRNTMNESSKFAIGLVKHMRKVTKTLTNAHRFAGFAVLKSPDIPSILVEMGFLSNRVDEKALLNPKYRAQIARSIGKAVDDYFLRY
jgi:N-acetylmuramoyl-L-alanine amidase